MALGKLKMLLRQLLYFDYGKKTRLAYKWMKDS
jgi:hypothetical protein